MIISKVKVLIHYRKYFLHKIPKFLLHLALYINLLFLKTAGPQFGFITQTQ